MKKLLLLFITVLLASCNKTNTDTPLYTNGETNVLKVGNCLATAPQNVSLCFNEIVSDSRCPTDLECFWAGEAVVNFTLYVNGNSETFDLSTINTLYYSTAMGYTITLEDVKPYPISTQTISLTDYIVDVTVTME